MRRNPSWLAPFLLAAVYLLSALLLLGCFSGGGRSGSVAAAGPCPANTWPCADGIQCINVTLRCNSVLDCSDGSDEGAICNSTCSANEFKCLTSDQCIRKEYICDHDNDCEDGSDESLNCTYPACPANQFTCDNKRCVAASYVCDRDNDCLDNSDEKYCAARNCPPNQLACNSTAKCVDVEKFCNSVSDCPDGSDEGSTCSSNRCLQLSCSYGCHATPRGGVCYCPRGQMLNPANNRTCIDVNECEMWDECDHICVNANNSYSCQCKANYTLEGGGHCRHVTSDSARIVFSLGSKIYETNQQGQNMRTILDNDNLDVNSFDYNYATNTFYIADAKNNRIYKGAYSTVGSSQLSLSVIVNDNLLAPFQLAVDWVTDKIYVSETRTSRIDVFSSDGRNRTNLITSNVYSPASIALDPADNYMFFTDLGYSSSKLQAPKIERACMDGSGRQVIVKDKLLEPIAITVDPIKKRIYWIDRKYDHLETSTYFGLKRYIIAAGSQNMPHSVALDIFESTIYYADTTKLAILKMRRHTVTTEANITTHYKINSVSSSFRFKAVRAYHATKQARDIANPCQVNNGGCQHFCLLSHVDLAQGISFRCKCKIGYYLRRDLKTCERFSEYLVVSQMNIIRGISTEPSLLTETRTPVLIPQMSSARAIEVDSTTNRTFFFDPIKKAIFVNKYAGEETHDAGNSTPFVPDGLVNVENLAYDWVSKNLYFTNMGKITVVQSENPRVRRDLIRQAQVYGIALDPNSGFMFYSTILRPAKIVRAFLDGTNSTVICQRALSLPYSISVDYVTKRVYWADAQVAKIQYSDYSGNNPYTLVTSGLAMPISILVYKFYLYYVDYRLSSLYKTSKFHSVSPTLLRSNLNNLYQVKLYSTDYQKVADNHPCARQNGDCSHFCFAVPSPDSQYQLSRHCGCPFGMKLDSNQATCVANPDEPTTNPCALPALFKCNNNRCIRRMDVCDGINDCLDFSDEMNCPTTYCSPTDQFQCRNGTCLPINKRCDGRIDCLDFSDEMNCPRLNCLDSQFKCSNGSCIPQSWRCDSDNDCGDASDEANCTTGRCDPLTQFECLGQDGRCIDKAFVCDGDNDCSNNHDEENCPSVVCSSSQFKCALDNLCINATKRCDGNYDCPSFEDEQNCRFTPIQRSCRENEFQCTATRPGGILVGGRTSCIPSSWKCDGHVDCDNGSDEPDTCVRPTCPAGYFRCNNTRCIPQQWVCDAEDDCGDNSDERNNCPAQPFQCPYNQVKCVGSMDVCINRTQLCDSVPNCPDGTDEGAYCSRDDCSVQNGGCSHMCLRSPTGSMCFCPVGYATTNATNYKKCEDINECEQEKSCSQLCANVNGGYNCACEAGYIQTEKKLCKAVTRRFAKVYVTNGNSLLVTNLEGTSFRAMSRSTLMGRVTGFDYHNRTGRIYWADRGSKSIYSAFENGTNIVKLVGSGVGLVEALAVDWIGQNLYWADYVMQHIEVSRIDGRRRKILFNENVTNPRALVLDPRAKSRYIFWTDWGKFPRIERANMDGTNRTAIITTKIFWPNGLSVDLIRERLYFADAHLDYIESCDYFGGRRRQIVANDLMLHHPHSMSLFEDQLYWIDRGHRKLMKVSRFSTGNKTAVSQVSASALHVKIAHALLQPYEDNPCARSNCEHLCLLSRNSSLGYKCECQIGYTRDTLNDNRCNIDQSEFLLVLNKNIIGGMRIFANDTTAVDDVLVTPDPGATGDSSADASSGDDESASGSADLANLVRESGFLWDRLVPVNDIHDGYDFTYDYKDQFVYWIEHDLSQGAMNIQRVKFDGEKRETFISGAGDFFSTPFCMEFDALSRNLFVGDMIQSQIEVINVDNQKRSVVFAGYENETGVGHPLMLALNSQDAEIYWIDEGFEAVPKKIGAVRMDGLAPRVLVQTELNSPNAIFYHARAKKLYWADTGRRKIECVSVGDPSDRSLVLGDVDHVGGLAVWDVGGSSAGGGVDQQESVSILYYSDQVQEQLVAYNLKTSEKRIILTNVPNIMALKLYQQPQFGSYSSGQANPCLVNNGGCHQICIPSLRNGLLDRTCRCSHGLQLQVQDGSCKPFSSFLFYSNKELLRALPYVDANEPLTAASSTEALPPVSGNGIGKADFDYKSKSIVWIEDERLVYKLALNFSWQSDPRVSTSAADFVSRQVLFELNSATGSLLSLALDWVNNMLYYSYADPPFNYIKVCKYPSADNHATVFSSKLDRASVIAVNPRLRYLYWMDQAQFSKLERSNLDGSNRTVLLRSDIASPTDLFVDVTTGDVYWSDNTKDRIEKCSWDGKNRTIIKSSGLPNTQSIYALDNVLYYVDSRLRGLYSLNLTTPIASNSSNSSTSSSLNREATLIKKLSNVDAREVFVFADKSQPIADSPCSYLSSVNNCDQLCFAMPGQNAPKCACALGELDSNGRTCKTPKEYVIFAAETEIRSLNIPTSNAQVTNGFTNMPWKPITSGMSKVIGVDFDYRDNKIIFSDVNAKRIGSFVVRPGGEDVVVEQIISQTSSNLSIQFINKPEGVAYDWVADTVYWTDNQLDIVAMLKLSTGMRYIVGYSGSPRAIAVHPCKGLLFWTDVGSTPMIARSSLSGSNFQKIITQDIKWPNGLTIDFDDDKLYWADAYYDKIERTDLDGNYRQVILTALHPFALSVHGHYVYWTDWQANSVYRAEKYRGSNMIQLIQGLASRPMDIQVWSEQRQKCEYNPCSVFNGGCSHMCSVAPPGNRTECRCPFGLRLRLANNDRTCAPMSAPRCNATQFTCGNGQCISRRLVCDGIRHCADNSDEAANYCAYYTCQPSEFRCRNGRCIPMPERCDRVDQCSDNSDEANCVYPQCNAQTEFQCRNFKCIPLASRCNGVIDCFDGNSTDEVGCPPITCNTSTSLDVKCPNTNICIMRRWLCDGDNDCGDNADENRLFCNSVPCAAGQFRCRDHKCIPYSWFCDGDRDCSGGEDEPPSECRYGNYTCPPELFKCDSGRCINKDFVCDGDRDCLDNSDEDEDRHNCLNRPCRPNEFRCESGVRGRNSTKCIRAGLVCDGYAHCLNSEDETNANCSRRDCRANEFRCQNGLCINANYKCDHDDDCGDGSDEPRNCTYSECTAQQFKCDNLRCIPAGYKCNGRNDCFDNSDEKASLCDNSTSLCPPGQYKCRNGRCISIEFVCNNRNDCGDNSDESGCGVNECASPILNRCDHSCIDTITSFRCECRRGYKLVDRYRCIDVNECKETPWVCTQLCDNRPGSYSCKCAEGYEKSSSDARLCKKVGPRVEANLLFTNNYYLRNISLETNNYQIIRQGFSAARGIAYDYNTSTLYVLDGWRAQLLRIRMNLSAPVPTAVSTDVLIGDLVWDERGLAYDWVGLKLYYLNSNRLTVCDTDGHSRSVLLNGSVLQEATSLVLDPKEGYVFFTDWAFPAYIGRVGLDGRNFTKIVTDDVSAPIGLAIDVITKRIFWTDTHLKRIEYSDYNGRNRFVAVQPDQTAYPYAIAFYNGLIYWSDRANHSIFAADALNGSNRFIIHNGTVHSAFDLKIYHYSLQPASPNPCGANNGGCSHLCLISAGGSSYKCACPTGFVLDADDKSCKANCSSWYFRCGPPDDRCVPINWKCDGEKDCKDGSDEQGCPPRTCPAGVFQCNNSRCVGFNQICNGFDNCQDESDEKLCTEACPPGRFQCPVSKRCIPSSKVCDGRNDCGDLAASDEQNCANQTCPAYKFRCNSGHCIDASYYCDEDNDCPDHSDEPGYTCRNRACPAGWSRCGNNSYKCIHNSKKCDGYRDCPSGDDETPSQCQKCHATGDFKCANNRCIMLSLRCNQVDDCGDNSDESPLLCNSLPRRECSESEFRCSNGRCIPGRWRCNHANDCGDNSDETGCNSYECPADRWKCASGHCILARNRCNGIRNCLDFSDETSCPPRYPDGKYCLDSQFTCNNTFCVETDSLCEGYNDCGDNSDELLSFCSSYNCTEENDRFRCKNGLCIHVDGVCNGFNDCADGSDEDFSSSGPCKRTHVECDETEFKCAASHHCIPIEYVCDKDLDCGPGDESDELGCYSNSTVDGSFERELTCESSGNVCEHECTNFPQRSGFVCSCHHGFAMVKVNVSSLLTDSSSPAASEPTGAGNLTDALSIRRHSCVDIDECQSYMSHCAQSCTNSKGSYKCSCAENYYDSHGDGSVCEAAWREDSIVLVAYGSEIRQLRQNFSDYSYKTLIEDENFVLSIDVDPLDRYVYWIDEVTQLIKRSYIPVTSAALGHAQLLKGLTPPPVVRTASGVVVPMVNRNQMTSDFTALSIDWLAKNLYVADGLSHSIKVAKVDGRYMKTLIRENTDLVYSIAVNPVIGMVFWINSGRHHTIMSAWMNGENVKVLVNTRLESPTGLSVDYFMDNRIYWCDSRTSVIEVIKPDGTDRVKLDHVAISHPFKIDAFENHVYWMTRDNGSVAKVDKFVRGARIELISGLDLVEDLKVYHPYKVPSKTQNPCSNSTCSHLCLLKPNNDYECACPDNSTFVESDVAACDSALEEPLEAPLSCKCVGCLCFYYEQGVHFKCLPGWKGDLCEINIEAANRALIQKVTTYSAVVVPVLAVIMLIVALSLYSAYRQRNNQDVIPCAGILPFGGGQKLNEDRNSQSSSFGSNLHNSELSPSEIDTSRLSISTSSVKSKSSMGFLNPIFTKQTSSGGDKELSMDPMTPTGSASGSSKKPAEGETSETDFGSLDINAVFSSNLDNKEKEKKKFAFGRKKKGGDEVQQAQYEPTSKETFKDTVNLVEQS